MKYFWENIICDPLVYTMDHPDFIVWSFIKINIVGTVLAKSMSSISMKGIQ